VRALVLAVVAAVAAPAPAFRFADPRIAEASGIAAGLRSPGVVYVQNDSGDTNRFFDVDTRTGLTAAMVVVPGATNVDWEDLAVARDARGVARLWLADTGENDAARSEVRVYRVREPRVAGSDRGRALVSDRPAVWRLRYPDGPVDAEGLAVAPGGAAYVVTKSPFGRSTVYRLPARPDPQHVQPLQRVAAVALVPHGVANPFGVAGELAVTGAAFSPDGRRFAIRTYAEAYVWTVGPGGLAATLRTDPLRIALPAQPQGEGVAFAGDRHLIVDSEGRHSAVFSVPLPALPAPSASLPPPPSRSSSAPRSSPVSAATPRRPGSADRTLWFVAVATGAAALAAAALLWARSSRRRLK